MAAVVGTLKSTGKKYYFTPVYEYGKEYWVRSGVPGKFSRDEIDGLPEIKRDEFLAELRALLNKYNASVDVSYDENVVLGDPYEIDFCIGDFSVLTIEGRSFDANSLTK